MNKLFVIAHYMFLFTFCIDQGDGLWNKTDEEPLRHDIKMYKKIAEKVERDLQEFYNKYGGPGRHRFNFHRHYYDTHKKIPKRNLILDNEGGKGKNEDLLLTKLSEITDALSIHNKEATNDSISNEIVNSKTGEKLNVPKSNWPKFEDILLGIGKKYDWKNDRWIKVKQKFKIKDKNFDDVANNIEFHDKHRFSYRTIKLNRGKNKRNVVIAVTAIR